MVLIYLFAGIIILFLILLLTRKPFDLEAPQNLSDEDIRRAAQQGNKIQAIAWYRKLHSTSLRAAKSAVEKMTKEAE